MSNPAQLTKTARKKVIACWIGAGVSVLVIALGIVIAVTQKTNTPPHTAEALGTVAACFGGVALFACVFLAVWMRKQWISLRAMATGEHEIWVRWTCSDQQAARFLASEAQRNRLTPQAKRYLALLMIGLGVLCWYVQYRDFNLRVFFLSYGLILVFFSLCFAITKAVDLAKTRQIRKRATSEVILAAEGVLWGDNFFGWRMPNWGLLDVTYESGDPDVLNLVFLAGTMPGSAALGVALQVAYNTGVTGAKGSTQNITPVRLPVPPDKADQVRELASTAIAKQLLAPRAVF